MIKSPITNTGEIRYVELVKVFFLLSFFYAFTSFITDSPSFLLSNTPKIVSSGLLLVFCISLFIMTINDSIELYQLIKSFVIRLFIKTVIKLHTKVSITIKKVVSLYTTQVNHLKLCVIRC